MAGTLIFYSGLCYSPRPDIKGIKMKTVSCELDLVPRDWLRILMLLGENNSETRKIITLLKQTKDSSCKPESDLAKEKQCAC